MRIIETDNFGRDYPNEKFLNLPPMTNERATAIANVINRQFPDNYDRYWRVVDNDYVLSPGFEP